MSTPQDYRHRARLTLTIDGVTYNVRPCRDSDPTVRAYTLRKEDGTVYRLRDGQRGAECTCPAFQHHRKGETCKHVNALRIWWLVR